MKVNPIVKLIIFAAIPLIVIIILFKLNIYAGFIGILVYLLLAMLLSRVTIYRMRGQIEYQKGNIQNAARWFGKAVKTKKAGTELKVNYGFILFKSGQLAEAEKLFLEAIRDSKSSDEKNLAKSNLALVLWKKGELDHAVEMLKEVISEYKTTAVYGSLGFLITEQGDLDEALKVNLEAWEYNKENAIIQDNLAHLWHLRGEMDKAGDLFKKLIEKEPHFPEAYYDYAQFLEDSGQVHEAVEMYKKALSCKFSFNSTVTKEQVQKCLDEIMKKIPESD